MEPPGSQKPSPAICPRCGHWFPAGARRCPVHRVVLVRPDEPVRRFGPEDLTSTIPTVVERPRPRPRRLHRRGRWPTQKPRPLKFFEASTRPGEERLHTPVPAANRATVITDDDAPTTAVEIDGPTARRQITTPTPPGQLPSDPDPEPT